MKDFIPEKEYKKILDLVPIPCIDAVVVHDGEFLMVKRTNEPLKGEWCFPGGRIFKGEMFVEAINRKLKEETGLTGKVVKILGPYETMFKEAPLGVTTGVHSVNVVVLMEVDDISSLKVDDDHSSFGWFSKIEEDWHPYLKEALKDCGFE
jgi:colanic acid biosynthesis protein WcaH